MERSSSQALRVRVFWGSGLGGRPERNFTFPPQDVSIVIMIVLSSCLGDRPLCYPNKSGCVKRIIIVSDHEKTKCENNDTLSLADFTNLI